ncbi:efflux RND transporter permease subunit [Candidatus Marithrix sp. Canyon 246]|uniref:efflux RND transporter permease subunit n=1 Tax=Candidatus Marithrix sp. Canyon 246 TaxID=1827136 RepID=UPI00084A1A1C|nr:efflux RND transporter permease subunit [Candidatus Marithrix sp. Canyon 246]
MIDLFAKAVVRWRWIILLVSLAFAGAAAFGGKWLGFSTDYRVYFSEDNPELRAFEELQNTYEKADNILFVIAPKDGQIFSQKNLAAIEQLTREAWKTPYSTRVESITNFQYSYAIGDEVVVGDLVRDAQNLDDKQLKQVKAIALSEPTLVGKLVSPQAHVAGVNVTVQLPGVSPMENYEIVMFVRDLATRLQTDYPNLTIHLTGMVMYNNAFMESAMADNETLIPLMYVVIALVLLLLLRSFLATVAAVLTIFMSMYSGLGISGWLGTNLTTLSTIAPTIILTVSVAYGVHVLVSFLHAMREGRNRHEAVEESLRINLSPVFITSLTTAVGFLSMNFSEVPPFRDLGNIVALGVGMAFLLSITFLPALIAVLPLRVKVSGDRYEKMMLALANFVIHKRILLLTSLSLIILVFIAMIPRNELNDKYPEWFDESITFRQANDFTTENLTGLFNIEYSLKAAESGGISEPSFLATVEKFSHWLRTQPEVLHVATITDVIKRINKNMHEDKEEWYRLPENRELTAQYLLLYELSLPYGLDITNQINIDKSATRLVVTLKNMSTNGMLVLEKRIANWLTDNAQNITAVGASTTLMFSHIGDRNIRSMIGGTVAALVLISVLLILVLRSFKVGMLSLVSNLVPIAVTLGVWGLFVGEVGLSLAMMGGMILGIVVDDTVHFLSKYLRARRERNLSSEEAVRYAFSSVGVALVITSLTLMAGFLVLTLSTFKLNSDMGLTAGLAIGIALIVDLFLLPLIIMKLEAISK